MGLSSDFLVGVFTVVLIDIVLAGDNAVVIAMAAKSLPQDKRRRAIIFGAGLAVLLRIVLTVFAAQLLQISLVKLVGGLLIIWIGVKLLVVDDPREETTQAVWQPLDRRLDHHRGRRHHVDGQCSGLSRSIQG